MPGSHRHLRSHDHAARERLADLARARGRVFSPADLPAAGVDEATFRRLRRDGRVRPLQWGVYADAAVIDAAMRDEVDWHLLRGAAAIRSLRREAWLTSTTALHIYGVAVPHSEIQRIRIWRPADVDRRGGQNCPASGSLLVELGEHLIGGISVVPPAVAAVHAACHLPKRWGLVACDGVLAAGLASHDDLARARRTAGHSNAHLLKTLGRTLRNTIVHPVVLPVIAGLAWNLAGLPLPTVADEILATLAQAVVPLCLVLIGMSLAYYGVKGAARGAVIISLLKLLVLPAMVLAMAHWGFGLSGLPLAVVVMMAALPVGSNALIFSQRYETLEAEATAAIVFSTLGFVMTASLWLAVLAWLG